MLQLQMVKSIFFSLTEIDIGHVIVLRFISVFSSIDMRNNFINMWTLLVVYGCLWFSKTLFCNCFQKRIKRQTSYFGTLVFIWLMCKQKLFAAYVYISCYSWDHFDVRDPFVYVGRSQGQNDKIKSKIFEPENEYGCPAYMFTGLIAWYSKNFQKDLAVTFTIWYITTWHVSFPGTWDQAERDLENLLS